MENGQILVDAGIYPYPNFSRNGLDFNGNINSKSVHSSILRFRRFFTVDEEQASSLVSVYLCSPRNSSDVCNFYGMFGIFLKFNILFLDHYMALINFNFNNQQIPEFNQCPKARGKVWRKLQPKFCARFDPKSEICECDSEDDCFLYESSKDDMLVIFI